MTRTSRDDFLRAADKLELAMLNVQQLGIDPAQLQKALVESPVPTHRGALLLIAIQAGGESLAYEISQLIRQLAPK